MSQVIMDREEYNKLFAELTILRHENQKFLNRQQALKDLISHEVERNISRDDFFFTGCISIEDLYPMIDADTSFNEFNRTNERMWRAIHEKNK